MKAMFLIIPVIWCSLSFGAEPDVRSRLAGVDVSWDEFGPCDAEVKWDYVMHWAHRENKTSYIIMMYALEGGKHTLVMYDSLTRPINQFQSLKKEQRIAMADRSTELSLPLAQALYSASVHAAMRARYGSSPLITTGSDFYYLSVLANDIGRMSVGSQMTMDGKTTGLIRHLGLLAKQLIEAADPGSRERIEKDILRMARTIEAAPPRER